MITPAEFKNWIEKCKRDAKAEGMTDDQIYLEFLEQVRHMTSGMMIKSTK